jgi:Metal binding domain of Ada
VAREIGPRRALIPTAQAVEALRGKGFRDYPKAVLHGSTGNFNIYYSPPLGTIGQQIANAMLGVCERDYSRISQVFGGITPAGLPFNIILAHLPQAGAYHYGHAATTLYCDIRTTPSVTPVFSSFLAYAQLVEVFETAHNRGWDSSTSHGEGLSRVLATARYPRQIMGFVTAAAWLNHGRPDFVNRTDRTDINPVSTGCAALFLNYLRYQLNYRWRDIVAVGGPTLSVTYLRLTGDPGNPFPAFAALLAGKFPVGQRAVLSRDNPFPIQAARPRRARRVGQETEGSGPVEVPPQAAEAPEEFFEGQIDIVAIPSGKPATAFPGDAALTGAEEADGAIADVFAEVEEEIEEVPVPEPDTDWSPGFSAESSEFPSPDSPAPDTEVSGDDLTPEVPERTSGRFIGNKNTRIYHPATSANLPAEENRVYFDSATEAIESGFRPAWGKRTSPES